MPTNQMLCGEMAKDMDHTVSWELFYSYGFLGPAYQPELPEDLASLEDGKITRWRIDADSPTKFE